MLEHLKQAFARRRAAHEIDSLDDRELEDLGLSRAELHVVAETRDEVIARQTAMARRHGLTDRDFNEHRHDYAAVVERCRTCGATGECARFLADPAAGVEDATFCPNAEIYGDLAATPR